MHGIDYRYVTQMDKPSTEPGEVIVEVRAAAKGVGEAAIRPDVSQGRR